MGEHKLIFAHFFFVDIVGLSDPKTSAAAQIKKLNFLNQVVSQSKAFRAIPRRDKLVLPTGDGMAIAFLRGAELPLELAIELNSRLRKYNVGKLGVDSIEVRIGIHSGACFVLKDLNKKDNVWGPGIILARRIMDMGDPGHILLSSTVANNLKMTRAKYGQYLHQLRDVLFKHNVKLRIFSAYSNNTPKFGNPRVPDKIKGEIPSYLYPYVEVRISILDSETELVHYKRIYEIENQSDSLMSIVSHQIASDLEKESLDDLHFRVYDEDGKDLAITRIIRDEPHQKEFETAFLRPIKPGGKQKYYVEYKIEEPERYFENKFLTDCGRFVVLIDYPSNSKVKKPVAYEVEADTDKKIKHEVQPVPIKQTPKRITMKWETEEALAGQAFRFEW